MRRPRTIRAWAVLVWLALWQLGAMAIDQQIILVSPLRVLSRLWELIPTPDFWGSIAYSLVRITAGFLLGVAAGTVLAALSARFRRVEELLAPAMLAIKSIPVASFIILALILFSSRNLAVPISFLIVLPVLYSNVLGGIRAADSQLMEMARVFRIPVGRSIRYVYLPQVMPYFLSACGSALGLCWKSGIAAEVIGMPEGSIGEQLQQAKVYLDTPDLFAWTLVIVLISLSFEKAFLALLRKAVRRSERMCVGGADSSEASQQGVWIKAGAAVGLIFSAGGAGELHYGAIRLGENHIAADFDGAGAAGRRRDHRSDGTADQCRVPGRPAV